MTILILVFLGQLVEPTPVRTWVEQPAPSSAGDLMRAPTPNELVAQAARVLTLVAPPSRAILTPATAARVEAARASMVSVRP